LEGEFAFERRLRRRPCSAAEFQHSRFAVVENKIWMRLRTISKRFAPQTLIRGSIGGGTCPRSVLWRSILRSATLLGGQKKATARKKYVVRSVRINGGQNVSEIEAAARHTRASKTE
jgi:hypothetical protein